MEKGKILALDYGKRRIGVASGDLEMGIAFPRMIIENKGFDFVVEQIKNLCKELEVKMIIVGLPLSMEETQQENSILQEIQNFVEKLGAHLKNIPIELLDERLSTFEAEEVMREYNIKSADDLYAAQIILQRFFHKLKP